MSRVLKNGNNQITQSYQAHYNKVKSGLGWAIGTDVVKYKNQLDYVVAHSEGTVLKVVNYLDGTNKQLDNEGMGYGNYVMILHNNNVVTLYAHLTKVTVKQGQKVAKGTTLAFMGNTGNSSGAHLHFEVRQYKSAPTAATLHDNTKFEFLNSEKYLDADLPSNATNIKAIGFLDTAKCSGTILTCSGWAYKGAGGQVVTIKIFNGSKEVKKFDIMANKSRPDVKAAMGYTSDKVGFSGSVDLFSLSDGIYTIRAYVGADALSNTFMIDLDKPLTATSYLNYSATSNDFYRVRKSFTDAKSAIGAWHGWSGAFNAWNANKNNGYHIYDKNGKQLD